MTEYKNNNRIKFLAKAAIIAALYIVTGLIFKPWDFYALQLRPSEALNVLVFFSPAAAWGLFVGCIINNLSSPFGLVDIVFGSLATLVSGLIGNKIKNKFLVGLPSVIINGVVVATYVSGMSASYFSIMISIMLSQLVSVYVIGLPLLLFIDKNKKLRELIHD